MSFMPASFYHFMTCLNTLKKGVRNGDKTVVCEGYMRNNEIKFLESEYSCSFDKEIYINGKTIYKVDFKE